MRLVTRIYLTYGFLLAMAVGGAVLAGLGSSLTAIHLERVRLAQEVYLGYLSLSNHSYQLFKQFGDAILIGDSDGGAAESELIGKMQEDVREIRELIGHEIRFVGAEEIEELNLLAQIESLAKHLIVEHNSILMMRENGTPVAELHKRLSRMHDQTIDRQFNRLIHEAIQEEANEVSETRRVASREARILSTVAILFIVISATAATTAVWLLIRDLRRPLNRLKNGAAAIAQGDFERRVDTAGPEEFGDLARSFNHMVDEIASREAASGRTNLDLEETVAARTAELKDLLDAQKASEQKRKQLLADVSHELRTPLTIIRGEADIALRGGTKTPKVYRDALERTRSAAVHTSRLVDDLLFVARREAGNARLKIEEFDLVDLLRRLTQEGVHLDIPHPVMLHFSDDVRQRVVRADRVRIRQVMLILLENAIHYGGEAISVRVEELPANLVVSVSDNGDGMTAEEQARAFDRFFRGSDAAGRYERGAGLGLPVAKAIIEAHGGEIALRSEPGEGLTVSFTLPVRPTLRAVS